jgi:hypothetical protein
MLKLVTLVYPKRNLQLLDVLLHMFLVAFHGQLPSTLQFIELKREMKKAMFFPLGLSLGS